MKIAFISQPWNHVNLPVPDGSIMIWMYEVANRLTKNAEVLVYGQQSAGQPENEIHNNVTYRRVSVQSDLKWHKLARKCHRLLPHRLPGFAADWFYKHYIRAIARDLQQQDCDVIHLQNLSQFAPLLRRCSPNSKIVLHMHCEWLSQLDKKAMARRIDNCDLILGCSDYIANKVAQKFPQFSPRCRAVYNGVDTIAFSPANPGQAPRRDGLCEILFVGRISPEKGLHDLIEALGLLKNQGCKFRLKLVGPQNPAPREYIVAVSDDESVRALDRFYQNPDGTNYLTTLQQRIEALGLQDQIELTGPLTITQLADLYRNADILVNPSLSESFGMSLIEALACATPVIATRTGGMTEIVEKTGGAVLAEPDDVASLADALATLINNPEKRKALGQTGREKVAELFSWDSVTGQLHQHYQELLSQGGVV